MLVLATLTLFSRHVTRLGEESAEAMVIVGSFALFGEITVRLKRFTMLAARAQSAWVRWVAYLNAVFEAVKLYTDF